MENETALVGAIENLYRIFERYPLRKHVEGCSCCVSEADERALHAQPLRQLSQAELYNYAFSALLTWGNTDDFRHFLPRIFELLATKDGLGCDEEIVLGKLALADWQKWPDEEQVAVRDYFRAVWNSLLLEPATNIEPNAWLCGLGRAGEDLLPFLEHWLNLRNPTAYEQLGAFINPNSEVDR